MKNCKLYLIGFFIFSLIFLFCSEDQNNLSALDDLAASDGNSIETQTEPNPALYQNYPNPFYPTTIIEFSIQATCHVRLKVLTIEWEEVETLIDKVLPSGLYRLRFYSKDLPNGEYYYVLDAAGTRAIGKMKCAK
jgi:hypothetical protein